MDNKTITSTLDIVNWFCRKAAAVGTTLDENKIQHLLFLAQIHYALKSGHFLMPSLFVCSRSGFYEPTVRVLMRFGLPLLPEPCFKTEINTFLELIWQNTLDNLKPNSTVLYCLWIAGNNLIVRKLKSLSTPCAWPLLLPILSSKQEADRPLIRPKSACHKTAQSKFQHGIRAN